MQRIRTFFTTHIAARLWLLTVVPIVVVTLGITLLTGVLFDSFLLDNAIAEAAGETADAASQFSRNYRDMLVRLVRKAASTEFREEALEIVSCPVSSYTEVNNNAQGILTELQQINSVLQAAVIVKTGSRDGEPLVFASYNYTLREKNAALKYDLSAVNGMTLLPVETSPVLNRGEAIPLVVPLHFVSRSSDSSMLLICDSADDADLILYLYLDADAVREYLDIYCNDAYEGTLYLADAEGHNVSLGTAAEGRSQADDPDTQQAIADAVGSKTGSFRQGNDRVYVSNVSYTELYLVNIVPDSLFTAGSDSIRELLIVIGASGVAAVTLLCLMISLYMTTPLRSLMQTVRQIKDDSYDGNRRLDTPDEFGQLDAAVNEMYATIQAQIRAIKQEEQEKFDAKMQLLTEQINPHFLYNTLEFINMEVLSGKPENASRMINALGDYTRISLAYGQNTHTVARELDLVLAYANIMGCRFSRPVDLLIDVPDELRRCEILKYILQPLVENSFKHGFSMTAGSVCPVTPHMRITMRLEGEDLAIQVTDNGAGIDIPRAEKILREGRGAQDDRHIGLHNIYERLTAYYGRADFAFSSLPYYENRVEIRLPARFFAPEPPRPPEKPAPLPAPEP